MKKIIFCLILLMIFVATPVSGFQNSPDGFRGIKWKDSPSTLSNSSLLTKEDDLEIYECAGDKMWIGKVPLSKICYSFYDKKFLGVNIEANSSYIINIMRILKTQYGEPYSSNEYTEYYDWADKNAYVSLKNDRIKGLLDLKIFSMEVVEFMDKEEKEKAKKASDDF